jgi:hypothetical protein
MPRRPDPRQATFLEGLERATPAVTPEDDAMVRAYVADILPRDVPTYIRRVLAVRPLANGRRPSFHADLEVFDGRPAGLRISGRLGEAAYAWILPQGDEPFNWDERRKAWRRMPEGTRARRRQSRVRTA